MIDPNAEIIQLRQRLRFKNLSEAVIDSICDDVSKEISIMTSDILADAMNEAVNAGGDIGSIDFIDEIRTIRTGASFDIITDSGNTDFSEAPFPMLPSLLKNAKVAKDGSLYKVIPMRAKGSATKNSTAPTTEAAYRAIETARRRAKDDQGETQRGSSSPDAMKGMDTVSAMQAISKSRSKSTRIREKSTEPAINFRVASSKQDASSKWVHPGRKMDMSSALGNINANLHDSIDRAVAEVIRKHEGQY